MGTIEQVIPALWLGGFSSAVNYARLLRLGVKVIVTVCVKPLTGIPKELTWFHVPLLDTRVGPIGDVQLAVDLVKGSRLTFGIPTLVHCWEGKNRSALVVGLVLRQYGYSASKAIRRLREVREGALSNERFARIIREGLEGNV